MKKYLQILRVAVSLTTVGILVYMVNLKEFLKQFSQMNMMLNISVFLILFVQYALCALRWKIVLTADGRGVPFFYLLKSYLIGNFIGLFLPSSFGGDVYRVYALKKYGRNHVQNASSVLFDRLVGLFALVSVSVISMCFFHKEFIRYPVILCYLVGIAVFWAVSSGKSVSLLQSIGSSVFRPVARIMESIGKYRNDIGVLSLSLSLALLFQCIVVLVNKIYCHALNIDIGLGYLFTVIPLIYLTEALPISINGIGVRESAFVFFFVQAGHSKEEALAVGLLVLSMRYIFSLTVGGLLVLRESNASGALRGIMKGSRQGQLKVKANIQWQKP